MNRPILSCENVSLQLDNVTIIQNVNFSLNHGEFHLLMGENGAGKTTFVRILSGVYPYGSYTGEITFKGKPLRLHSPGDAIKKGIFTIHQDTFLYENMSVAENLFAGLPSSAAVPNRFVSTRQKVRMANSFLAKHHVYLDSAKPVCTCDPALRRKLELLRLYLTEPELLILDEPVALVSAYDMDYFMELIRYFKEKNVAILCISHNYHAFLSMIDRFSVFYDNELKITVDKETVSTGNIDNLIFSEFCESRYPKVNVSKGAEVFCAENISVPNSVHNISFTLYKGEILGFFGRAGSGCNSLPRALFGLDPMQSGSIYVDRLPARILSPQDAIRLGLAYVTDERREWGLFENLDLLENIYAIKGNNFDSFWTRTNSEYRRFYRYTDKLNLDLQPRNTPEQLSGGEQQKLIIMRWLMSSAHIFLFHDPTQSVDIPSRIDIYNMFNDLLLKGNSILLFSSNLEELMGLCDRIIFVRDGIISGEISAEKNSAEIQALI